MRQGRVWDCMQPNPPGHVASQNQPPEKWGWANAGSYPPTGWGCPGQSASYTSRLASCGDLGASPVRVSADTCREETLCRARRHEP